MVFNELVINTNTDTVRMLLYTHYYFNMFNCYKITCSHKLT